MNKLNATHVPVTIEELENRVHKLQNQVNSLSIQLKSSIRVISLLMQENNLSTVKDIEKLIQEQVEAMS